MLIGGCMLNPATYGGTITLADHARNFLIAQKLGLKAVRFDFETNTVAPNIPNAAFSNCDFTYLDYLFDLSLAYGFDVIFGLYFAPNSGTWVGTDDKVPHADDNPYVRDLMLFAIARQISRGFPAKKIKFVGWNEPGETNFGALVNGEFPLATLEFCNTVYPAIAAEYPDNDFYSHTFTHDGTGLFGHTFTSGNLNVRGYGEYDAVFDVYTHLDIHLYPNVSELRKIPNSADLIARTKLLYDSFISEFENSVVVGLPQWELGTTKRIVCTELGLSFIKAGMRVPGKKLGGQKRRLQMLADVIRSVETLPYFDTACIYRVMNSSSAVDDEENAEHYGLADSDGQMFDGCEDFAREFGGVVLESETTGSTDSVTDPV